METRLHPDGSNRVVCAQTLSVVSYTQQVLKPWVADEGGAKGVCWFWKAG